MAISENDILIENTDVAILNGDFDIQDCNNQNIKHLVIAYAGNYVISPTIGAGIFNMQNQPITDVREVFAKIGDELKRDGYKYPTFDGEAGLESTELNINAVRIKIPKRLNI